MATALMFQGTGSDVGKSFVVAGLARALVRRGLDVAPFKPQNMSNNAAVTGDGGEIGRAQWLQALACKRPASVDMNPVLLKPEGDRSCQVVVRGRVAGRLEARRFGTDRARLMGVVLDSFARLCRAADIVLVEGAGSPAETNLRQGDIANMGFARAAGVPVVLIGDIDRGGVIASLVGTHAVLDADDRALIAGFLINKFRGEAALFDDGLAEIVARTGWPAFGVLPMLSQAARLPAEDAVVLERTRPTTEGLRIVVPMLSRIANFDDLDPLADEPGVSVEMMPPGRPLPVDADLVVLPGTKATLADLAFLREQGWDIDIHAHVRRGGAVLGLCGGYQMLGRRIANPRGIEGWAGAAPGLGLLDIETELGEDKVLRPVIGVHVETGLPVSGYEMHMGRTRGPDCARPLLHLEDEARADGAVSADGRIAGCYVHGLFTSDAFRHAFLARLGWRGTGRAYGAGLETALDAIAEQFEAHLDIDGLLHAAAPPGDLAVPSSAGALA